MSMFTLFADAAPAAAPAKPMGGLMDMLPIIIVFGVMIFFMMRSQKKQQQKRQQMLDKLVKGSKVLLQSGMIGEIVEVKADTLVVAIADGVKVEVVRNGIAEIIPDKETAAPAAK